MTNFLLERITGKRASWILLSIHASCPNEVEYKPFTKYVEWLEFTKGYSSNTVEQYAGHVARFIDFVYEASTMSLDTGEISDVIYYYQEYLLYARDSDNTIVLELCDRLGKTKKTSISSISQGIESAIGGFITLQIVSSESLNQTNVFSKFVESGVIRTNSQKAAIKSKDWLSGTVRGSLQRSFISKHKAKIFSVSRRARSLVKKKYDKGEDYPLELVEDLLSLKPKRSTSCFHRDMAIYSLLATIGCRTHEALQIRVDDIDIENRTIRLVNPSSRDSKGLTPVEAKQLSWKGRETELVLPMAPFDSYFWEHLRQYLKDFFRTNVSHDFVFQKSNGRPYFTTNVSDRNKQFRKYAVASGFSDIKLGLHSLRHMYGRYLLNYYPNGRGGYGMPMAYVQILMGHASMDSTKRYAIHDTDILQAYIETANRAIHDEQISLIEVKCRYIEAQVEELINQKKGLIEYV